MSEKEIQENILSLEENLKQFSKKLDEIEKRRDQVIHKLQDVVLNMAINLDEDNDKISQAKIQLLNTYNTYLKDSTNDASNKVQVFMKNKQNQDEQDYKEEIVEALSKISVKPKEIRNVPDDKVIVINNNDVLHEITKTINDRGCTIISTELKNDHTDFDK